MMDFIAVKETFWNKKYRPTGSKVSSDERLDKAYPGIFKPASPIKEEVKPVKEAKVEKPAADKENPMKS